MKAYLINLDRSPDRLERFRDVAGRLGFGFERIPAVDGNAPELHERAARLLPGWRRRKMGPNVLACFESHRRAWRKIIDSGDPYALVMEDDLVLAEDFGDLVNETLPAETWLPQDCDILRLETFRIMIDIDRKPGSHVLGRSIHRLRGRALGTGACIMTARAAKFLLKETEDIREPVDVALFNNESPLFPRLVIYQMVPAPAVQGHLAPSAVAGSWARSTLYDERAEIEASLPAPRGLRSTRIWREARRVKAHLKALATGTRYMDVPFG